VNIDLSTPIQKLQQTVTTKSFYAGQNMGQSYRKVGTTQREVGRYSDFFYYCPVLSFVGG
jgi:hypothetical protein